MAYEVTATRRRPKTFDDLAGQEFVAATLKNSLEKGHIAHAYLFSGPRGCGKTSAARILARALRCEKGPAANPCGVCPQCQEIFRGASMDVLEIEGASNTSVNDVRQIKEEVLFPPTTGRYKVYIIDEVHMLSNSAFNALLKTIEEPPPNVVFIFATTELQKVPATIRSRCQQFNFRLISTDTISALLSAACKEMNIQAEDEALFWIARESTGSCRDAYTIFDQVVSFSDGSIRAELIREKLGLVGLDRLNELAEFCADGNITQSLALLDAILSSGVAVETLITDLASYYHSLLLLKAGVTREAILGYPEARFSKKALARYDTAKLERAGELLFNLYRDIRFSVSPRFELETLISKLCWLDKWISPSELGDAIAKVQSILGTGNADLKTGGLKSEASLNSGSRAAEPKVGIDRPLAPNETVIPNETSSLKESGSLQESSAKEADSLTEEFNRMRADKTKGAITGNAQAAQENNSAYDIDPGVRKVLQVFQGKIVEEKQE